jgi:predicted RNase H-like nuclease (RuvC/YqgF family)
VINVKQNEIECISKEIDAWKDVVERVNYENTDCKKIIEELEDKNKKLIETMNAHIYNKAADYK